MKKLKIQWLLIVIRLREQYIKVHGRPRLSGSELPHSGDSSAYNRILLFLLSFNPNSFYFFSFFILYHLPCHSFPTFLTLRTDFSFILLFFCLSFTYIYISLRPHYWMETISRNTMWWPCLPIGWPGFPMSNMIFKKFKLKVWLLLYIYFIYFYFLFILFIYHYLWVSFFLSI